jgi:hypothetical protein
MQQKPLALAAALAAFLVAPIASAGSHAQFGFHISPSNGYERYANGTLGEIRASADPTSYAECGSNASMGWCSFVDPSGAYLGCYTTDPAQLTVIRSMGPDAYFSVRWLEQTAECVYVLSYASSRTMAKEN